MSEKHPKRPRDPAQLAKLMIDIASGNARENRKSPLKVAKRQGIKTKLPSSPSAAKEPDGR
jgi:hypothetical protein